MTRKAHNKLTQEQAIEGFKKTHGERYGYDKVVYETSTSNVEIYCFKHKEYFKQTPKSHKNGHGCNKCGREEQIKSAKKSEELFLEQMNNLYGDMYDFSKMKYINTKTDTEVVCKNHGVFYKKPCDLVKGNACKKCKSEKSKYNNKQLFIEESTKIFGDITDYSLVTEMGANTKVDLICTIHNRKFTLTVSARLSGQKCPKCSAENYRKVRTVPKEEYYRRANEAHNYIYTYDNDYITSKHAITFYCKEHGKQRRNSHEHLRGAGCKKCEKIGQHTDKISRDGYINTANGRITSLYLIECKSENENFYKIGKTFRGVESRFSGSLLPYDYSIIFTHEGDAGYIYDLEDSIHNKFKEYNYKPNKFFAGFSECYRLDLPINKILL